MRAASSTQPFDGFAFENLSFHFSAPSLRPLPLSGECISRLFTAETRRTRRLRREEIQNRTLPAPLDSRVRCLWRLKDYQMKYSRIVLISILAIMPAAY